MVLMLILGCKSKQPEKPAAKASVTKSWNRSADEATYELIQSELRLANSEALYLVINFAKRKLQLKLKGAVVWDYPMEINKEDSSKIRQFIERFQNDDEKLVRPVTGKHLFASKDLNSDSVLAIVSKVLSVNPELLQRDIPERFLVQWGNRVSLDIGTTVTGEPKSKFKNTMVEVGQVLNRPFGEAQITVKMKPEAAITFYRAVQIGLPTLIYP
jgi:hypothetical protein